MTAGVGRAAPPTSGWRPWATVAVAVGCLASGGCGRAHEATVLTPLEPEVVAWVRETFAAAHPDVGLRFEAMEAGALLERLRAERGDPSARVVWGAPSWVLATAAGEGLLAPAAPPWAAQLPERLRDPAGRWTASLVDPIVLAFDHEELSRSRAPRDWIDLLHPRFAGQVIVPEPGGDPGGTVLFAARAEASMREYGDILAAIDWFKRLDGQARRYEPDEDDLMRELGRGDGAVAPARLSSAEAARSAGGTVAWVSPESGAPLLVQGVAIAAGAADPAGAEVFVAWLGTDLAARGLADTLHRIPATLIGDPAALPWFPDATAGLSGSIPDADTLAAHLDAWLTRWRNEARGRGPRTFLPGG